MDNGTPSKPWKSIAHPAMPTEEWEQQWSMKFQDHVRSGELIDAIGIANCAHYSYYYFLSNGSLEDRSVERVFFNSPMAAGANARAAWWRSQMFALLATVPVGDALLTLPEVEQFRWFCEFFQQLPELDQRVLQPQKKIALPLP